MSNLRIFSIYDSSNYSVQNFKDISEFKNNFLQENNKPFIILNSFGSEYNQETISEIKLEEKNNQRATYLIHYYDGEKKYNTDENAVDDILLNQIEIDKLLSSYLDSKKSYLIKSKELCDEIIKRTESFKEDKERINDFIDTYGEAFSKDCKKYLDMIENSPKEIESLFPKFKDSMENNIDMYNDIMKKIEKIMTNEMKINSNYQDKRYIIKENEPIIKTKLLGIIDSIVSFVCAFNASESISGSKTLLFLFSLIIRKLIKPYFYNKYEIEMKKTFLLVKI